MKKRLLGLFAIVGLVMLAWAASVGAQPASSPDDKDTTPPLEVKNANESLCVQCHANVTPAMVEDWRLSKHSQNGIDCAMCHGNAHKTSADAAKAKIPTPKTCSHCHPEPSKQFLQGKHAKAWSAMTAMPGLECIPGSLTQGVKGCGGCHKIGIKTPEEVKAMQKSKETQFGLSSCDSCHTRHTFSTDEARQPQACQTCHTGKDHPQWDMYSTSKHGVRNALKQQKVLPQKASAPTCQSCHMDQGNHAVKTSWGSYGINLAFSSDKEWAASQAILLMGLGVLDSSGKATARQKVFEKIDLARVSDSDWQKERDKLVRSCTKCHSSNFAKGELAKGDSIIKEADRMMAEAITIVASLYEEGKLEKPKGQAGDLPDLLSLNEVGTPIEKALIRMFKHERGAAFKGAFHFSPEHSQRSGWGDMRDSLLQIKLEAQKLRSGS